MVFHCLRSGSSLRAGPLACEVVSQCQVCALDRENHRRIADEPAWEEFVGDMEAFLTEERLNVAAWCASRPSAPAEAELV